jgi:hypothetical protein
MSGGMVGFITEQHGPEAIDTAVDALAAYAGR